MSDTLEPRFARELDRIHRRNFWMAVWMALRQRAREHDNYYWTFELGPWSVSYRFLARHFYTAKAILCLLLQRYQTRIDPDAVTDIAIWDCVGPYGEYSLYEWQTLEVGHGIFSGWRCAFGSDSSG